MSDAPEGGPEEPAPVVASEERLARLESELRALRALAETGDVFTPPYAGGDEGGSVPPRPFGIPFPIHGEGGGGGGGGGGRVKMPRPPCFSGEDDLDVNDWAYLVETYFAGMGVRDEGERARILPLLLRGAAGKVARLLSERGVITYRELITALKEEFGPVDAVYRARQKLRRCRQGGRALKEYVREFRNLALSLPGASDEELKHTFIDGLGGVGRTQVELNRPGSLQEAILLATRAAAAVEPSASEVRGSHRGGGRFSSRPRDYRPGGRVNSVGGAGDAEFNQMVHQVTDSGTLLFPLQADRMGHLLGFLEKALRREWFRNKMLELMEKAKGAVKQVNLAQEPVVPGGFDLAEFNDSDEEEEQGASQSEAICTVGPPTQGLRTLMQINATLGDKRSTVLLDSGATCNVMPAAVARKLGVGYRPQDIPLEGFDNTVSKALGIASVDTVIGEGKAKLDFVVSKGGSNILVGKSALGTLGFTLDPALDQVTHKPTGLTYKTFTVRPHNKGDSPRKGGDTWTVKVLPSGYAPLRGQSGSFKLLTPSPGFVLLPGEKRTVELGIVGFLSPHISGMVVGTKAGARQELYVHPKLCLPEEEGEHLTIILENLGSKAIRMGAKTKCAVFAAIRRINPQLELQEKNSPGRSEA